MAVRYAVATGNWSATATWDGGTLPTSSDDVYADGKTVTIDQNVTVLSLRTTARSGGTAGGGFTMSTVYNIDCSAGTGFVPGTTAVLTISATSGTMSMKGNVANWGIVVTGDVTINYVGNILGGGGQHGINASGTSFQINMTGNVTGGSGGWYGIYATGNSAKITVTGNVTGYNTGCHGINATGSSAQVTVTGTVTGGYAGSAAGIGISGANAQLTITGNVNAGAGTTAYGVTATGASTQITVVGNITASGPAYGLYATGITSLVTSTGDITAATGGGNGIRSDATSAGYGVVASGNFYDAPSGTTAIHTRFLRITETSPSGVTRYANTSGFPNGTPISRVSPDLLTGTPAPANVRSGTVYGYNNELTGTLAVPPAASVANGVPVDNTTGTAALKLTDVASVVGAQIAATLNS